MHIGYCVKMHDKSLNKILGENCFYFILKWFLHDFCLIPLGKCASWRSATNRWKKFKFWIFWEHPLYEMLKYAFKESLNQYY